VGDIPIFVAHDSSDVWANRDRFYLDEKGQPTVVAGVPPDYFSETGQRWGNPLYRWDVMQANGYQWWIERFQAVLEMVDIVRIDHFRGFDAYWEIPASEPTAIKGEWIPGPGFDFFDTVKEELGDLPLIAEDLGVITEGVEALRDHYNLPGMKVLQFAWSDPKNPFLPHNHGPNSIVYSGTHDNNTTIGWFYDEVDKVMLKFMVDYVGDDIDDVNWDMIQIGMMSPAHTFVATMQDVLNLGEDARMNTPGVESGNWTWRFEEEDFEDLARERLGHFTWLYQRRPDQQEKEYGDAAVKSEPKPEPDSNSTA
jgi:4-alpha-glucanotransferase